MSMKRGSLLALISLTILVTSIAGYAAVMWTSPNITNSGNVLGYEIQLYRLDTAAQVTNIPWGNVIQGSTTMTEAIFSFTQKLVMKNTGDYREWLAWHVNGTLPSGITVTAAYMYNSAWTNLPPDYYTSMNVWNIDPVDYASGIAPGHISPPIEFTLTVDANAPRGAFSFNIVLLGASTASG